MCIVNWEQLLMTYRSDPLKNHKGFNIWEEWNAPNNNRSAVWLSEFPSQFPLVTMEQFSNKTLTLTKI